MTDDDDRIAYLEGEDTGTLDPVDRMELDALRALLADPATWVEPDPSLEDDVVAAITGSATATRTTAPPAAPIRLTSRRRRRWVAPAIGVAAAVLAALGVTAVVTSDDDEDVSFDVALAAPDDATDATDATGEAVLTRTQSGWRIELDATGLPRLDGGRFYQAWLRNADGVLVPVGSFNEGEDVVLWAGVSPIDFPIFSVTIETADGDQASSGQRVLVGEVDRS